MILIIMRCMIRMLVFCPNIRNLAVSNYHIIDDKGMMLLSNRASKAAETDPGGVKKSEERV